MDAPWACPRPSNHEKFANWSGMKGTFSLFFPSITVSVHGMSEIWGKNWGTPQGETLPCVYDRVCDAKK